jgi:hypothetical protein
MLSTVFGTEITSVRYATLEDVKRLARVDAFATRAIMNKQWVVIVRKVDGEECITDISKVVSWGGPKALLAALEGK